MSRKTVDFLAFARRLALCYAARRPPVFSGTRVRAVYIIHIVARARHSASVLKRRYLSLNFYFIRVYDKKVQYLGKKGH